MLKKAFLVISTLFLLAGCGQKTQVQPPEAVVVRVQKVNFSDPDDSSSYPGEVRGRYESNLAFQVGGKIVSRNVDVGSLVNPGDIIMQIDKQDIQQSVNLAQAQVESARSQFELARTNLERYQVLVNSGAISAAQFDQIRTQYDAADAAYRQAQAQYTQSANSLGYTDLRADERGVIASLSAEVGQVVAAGQVVAVLIQTNEMEVQIALPESKLGELQAGEAVTITFWALPEVRLSGVVREISPLADSITRTYQTRITIQNPPAAVRYGMTANVFVADQQAADAAILPLTAIYQTQEQPNVWLVKDGKASLQKVQVQSFGNDRVRVTQGLTEGDIVITKGIHKLREGQAVRYEDDEL